MKMLYAILAVVFLVGGCVNVTAPAKEKEDKVVVDDGDELANDDKPMKTASPEPVPEKCDEAINYQVLIDALPKEVNGYVGDEPEGQMLTFTNPEDQQVMRYSIASLSLIKDDKSIELTATDTCYIQFLSMAWVGFYEMDGTDGYLKRTTISGNPGWHQFDKPGDSYSYNIFVKDRVIVNAHGSSGVPDSDVTAAANAVDYGMIASAAK